ncbi:MAG: HDIG domain-containing protein [Anaerolineaceae bacterium]|nr:MAG: HDIG domain-containing protein [Anaerolineaceae bacterium]
MSILYRVTQFWWNVTADALPESARGEIVATLSGPEMDLFTCFEEQGQWHAYRVFRTLRHAGHCQPNLLAAALLHDVGKTREPLSIWDRVLIVIVETLLPSQIDTWGRGGAQGWKRPFVVRAQHARWGAEMAQAAGSDPVTVKLILRHQDELRSGPATVEDEMLLLLQWADDQN